MHESARPKTVTPSDKSVLITPTWYEMLKENTAGIPAIAMVLLGITLSTKYSDLHLAQRIVEPLLVTCVLKGVLKLYGITLY